MNKRHLLSIALFSAVLGLLFSPTSASASLIGDSVTVELFDGAGNSADQQTQVVTQGAGPEFILNTGSDEQVNVDIESSTISITYIENQGGFFTWGSATNPVTVKITSLNWIGQSGIISGANIVSPPSGFGETVQLIGQNGIQVDTNIMQANGFFQPVTVVVQLETTHTIGGELLPIDSTALLLAGIQSSAIWMLPVLVGAAGVGAFYIKTRMNKE